MILNDAELRMMFEELVGHNDTTLLNPASIDLRVGYSIQTIERVPLKMDLQAFTEWNPYWLSPGHNVLVATMETVTIPNGYVGAIFLKSSRAREGYNHSLAGYVDPGWSGVLTLELINATLDIDLPLYPGFKIAQLVVMGMTGLATNPYSGKYKGATCVQGSYTQPLYTSSDLCETQESPCLPRS